MARHQTLFKEIKVNVKKIRKHPAIKKIIVGPYENCRHSYSPGTILIKAEISNGFKLFGYDGSGVVVLYAYLKDPASKDEIEKYLNRFS